MKLIRRDCSFNFVLNFLFRTDWSKSNSWLFN